MATQPSIIVRFFKFLWSLFNGVRRLIINLVFFGVVGLFLFSLSEDQPSPIPEGAALVIHLEGNLVEEKEEPDPLALISGQDQDKPQEILLADLLFAIEEAALDDRISGILLKAGRLGGGLSKLEDVGNALARFSDSGKPVLMQGNWLDQKTLYLGSFADEIQLNAGGMVAIEGFGAYRLYYREALEKLKINTHLFRVGKYKSFAESYTRDSMSDEAREANRVLLTDLWQEFTDTVALNRQVDPSRLNRSLVEVENRMVDVNGDFAQLALRDGLVDRLLTNVEMRDELFERFGTHPDEEHAVNAVGLNAYLAQVKPVFETSADNQVAIIVAKGSILNGEQPAGTIGGESTSRLLRQARLDDKVKAVVLRIDSPGGSAFASEQIRQELLALKATGKPVVASMGSVAASGGYWIAASTDRIYAQRTTITGSIGIIGLVTTFEDTAAYVGIHMDGVGTTELSGVNLLRPLPDSFKRIIQMSLDKGYRDFIELVAESRNMPLEQVDRVAQGRVWSGKAALDLGLVDEIGTLDDATVHAAELAKLDDYDTRVIGHELSPEMQLLQDLFGQASAYLPTPQPNGVSKLVQQLMSPLEAQLSLDDPNHRYLLCLECQSF